MRKSTAVAIARTRDAAAELVPFGSRLDALRWGRGGTAADKEAELWEDNATTPPTAECGAGGSCVCCKDADAA